MLNLPPRLASRLGSSQFANLHTFMVAARHLSFALAAEELCLTPSAVSHRIARLEQALALRLFQRLTRQVRLTVEGERILAILEQAVESLEATLAPQETGLRGPVALYARPSVANDWLLPRLADFHRRHPHIALDLRTGNDTLDFRTQNLDLALVYARGKTAGLVNHRLMDETVTPVCSPRYAEEYALQDRPGNLRHCTLLHDALAWEHAAFDAEWQHWAASCGVQLEQGERRLTFDRADLCANAALQHIGVAIGRRHLIQHHLDAGRLLAPFGNLAPASGCSYYLLHPAGVRQPARVLALVEWLDEQSSV